MAVSIDRVYRTVLDILNKEQRGYVTPEEFNRFAQQAQTEIFEGYFFELGRSTLQYGKAQAMVASIPDHIQEKLESFHKQEPLTGTTLPADLYRIETMLYNNIPAFEKSFSQAGYMERSELTRGTKSSPYYTRQDLKIIFYPSTDSSDTIMLSYYSNFSDTLPEWKGTTMMGALVNNQADTVDFQLHASEEPELVAKILAYAGVSVRAADVVQAATQKDQQLTQSEQ